MAEPRLGPLWSGYESDGKVGFRLQFRGIHRHGVAAAEAVFVAGRSSHFDHYLWDDGWDSSLEFTGSAVLAQGWLEMRGELAPSYGNSPRAEVKLRWPLPEPLDWSLYRFGSLAETQGADPRVVTRLDVADLEVDRLPPTILEMRNLRSLRLRGLPLVELDPGLCELVQLQELQVYGAQLSELPAGLGRLRALERLQVRQCRLQSTPDDVWALPALRHLDLSHNQCPVVPERVDLPALKVLDLSHNRLTTLPEGLARLPQLEDLRLEGNPWESLPSSLLELSLSLPLAEKMRLFDYRYRGAGASAMRGAARGPSALEWDDSPYGATLLPEGVPEALRGLALRSLALSHRAAGELGGVGGTRFGGWPDLPRGLEYPTYSTPQGEYHYEFIAQLKCAELADLQGYLPRTGRLYFFLNNLHDMLPLVLYHEEEGELVEGASLQLTAETFYDALEVPYPPFAVTVQPFVSLPSGYAADRNPHLFEGLPVEMEPEIERLDELRQALTPNSCHEIHCHAFTQHESPQHQAALRHRGHPRDWVILLKVASLGGFQWGDAGELFYVIHKSDLARRDFSAVFCTCESS